MEQSYYFKLYHKSNSSYPLAYFINVIDPGLDETDMFDVGKRGFSFVLLLKSISEGILHFMSSSEMS